MKATDEAKQPSLTPAPSFFMRTTSPAHDQTTAAAQGNVTNLPTECQTHVFVCRPIDRSTSSTSMLDLGMLVCIPCVQSAHSIISKFFFCVQCSRECNQRQSSACICSRSMLVCASRHLCISASSSCELSNLLWRAGHCHKMHVNNETKNRFLATLPRHQGAMRQITESLIRCIQQGTMQGTNQPTATACLRASKVRPSACASCLCSTRSRSS